MNAIQGWVTKEDIQQAYNDLHQWGDIITRVRHTLWSYSRHDPIIKFLERTLQVNNGQIENVEWDTYIVNGQVYRLNNCAVSLLLNNDSKKVNPEDAQPFWIRLKPWEE